MDAKINEDYVTFAFDLKLKLTNWIDTTQVMCVLDRDEKYNRKFSKVTVE